MKNILILLFCLLSITGYAQFSSSTTKKIDTIENNSANDITLKPNSSVKVDNFTGGFALQSGSLKELEESAVTNTELGFMSGVTSSVQDQLDSKTPLTRLINTTAPLQGGGDLTLDRTLSILQSGAAQDGYLSSGDWNTFNNKQDALTFGDLTESTSSVLTISGGTGAVIGSGASIQVQEASTSTSGYITSADWNTFNGKQDAITGTDGDLYYWNSGLSNLGIGSNGQVLQVSALGFPEWADAPVSTTLDTKGQLQGFSTVNANVGPCTDDQILVYDSLEATGWKCSALPSTSPTTTEGDLIIRGTTEDERLPIGAADYLLTSNGTTASWQPAPVSTTLTTKGDIQTFDTANARLPVGVDGTVLYADSSEITGLKWKDPISQVNGSYYVGSAVFNNGCNVTRGTAGWGSAGTNAACNSSSVDGDILKPQDSKMSIEIPDARVDGHYKIVHHGLKYKSVADGECYFGLNTTETEPVGQGYSYIAGNQSRGTDYVSSTFKFNTSGNKTIYAVSNFQSGTGTCVWYGQASTPSRMTVHFYPDKSSTIATQEIGLTAETANEFSWQGSSTAVVSKENYDVINGNGSVVSTGRFFYTFNSGIFGVAPNCVCSAGPLGGSTQDWTCSVNTVNSGGLTVNISNNGVATSTNHTMFCSKQGIDVNKSQTIVGNFENINSSDLHFVEAEITGTPTVVNSTFTTMLFSEVKDTGNIYDPSTGVTTFTKSGTYDIKSQIFFGTFNATATIQVDVIVNGSLRAQNQCLTHTTNFNWICGVNRSIDINAGDTLYIRVWQNSGASRTVSTNFRSYLSIDEQPDYEAIVKNLSDQKKVCQTKYLSATGTAGATGLIAEFAFNNLTIGKKYKLYGKMQFTSNSSSSIDSWSYTRLFNGATQLQETRNRTVGQSTWYNNVHDISFTATATTTTFDLFSSSTNMLRTTNGSNMTLCELPDSTVINSTKFN